MYAIPETWALRKEDDHKMFYCPKCRVGRYYPQLSDKEKLKKQLANVTECCVNYERKSVELERSNIALKGHITRKKKQLAVA
jgi:hypothetical protein